MRLIFSSFVTRIFYIDYSNQFAQTFCPLSFLFYYPSGLSLFFTSSTKEKNNQTQHNNNKTDEEEEEDGRKKNLYTNNVTKHDRERERKQEKPINTFIHYRQRKA